ncbi:hypothetical protein FZO89_10780 [Luteimonas viscosa]|uniref:DUF600 family protein n=1 Tax=Luteimonas viscosa TaxID=1132694 RepID=A0A5D4XUN3_9GAMM|nr:hypothetical protein [Luteimonas viscosa]TYT26702.1 hypothetical protein FZO89_10780 [Luteimonas viscosa]
MSADKDALIRGIGELLVRDIATAGHDLDGYALIVSYADGARRISGFGYRDGEAPRAATPQTGLDTIGARLDELREATQAEGKAPWTVCVIQLRRAGGKLHAEFVYEDAERWEITPATLSEVAERARPA